MIDAKVTTPLYYLTMVYSRSLDTDPTEIEQLNNIASKYESLAETNSSVSSIGFDGFAESTNFELQEYSWVLGNSMEEIDDETCALKFSYI